MKNLITCLTVCVLSGVAVAMPIITENYKLLATDGERDDDFGYSVVVSGDTVLVGANGEDEFLGERNV